MHFDPYAGVVSFVASCGTVPMLGLLTDRPALLWAAFIVQHAVVWQVRMRAVARRPTIELPLCSVLNILVWFFECSERFKTPDAQCLAEKLFG